MSDLETKLRSDPLFRNRLFAATTISESIHVAQSYGIIVSGYDILRVRFEMMPELAEAECLALINKL